MNELNWLSFLPVALPTIIAFICVLSAFILKVKGDTYKGMGKEVSELLLAIIEAAKDRHFSHDEILTIIREGKDVVEEAEKLLATK